VGDYKTIICNSNTVFTYIVFELTTVVFIIAQTTINTVFQLLFL